MKLKADRLTCRGIEYATVTSEYRVRETVLFRKDDEGRWVEDDRVVEPVEADLFERWFDRRNSKGE